MKKRIVSLLMAALMTVSLLPTAAWAEVLEPEASQEPAAEETVELEKETPEETEAAPEETAPVEEEAVSDVQPYAVTDTPAVCSTTSSDTCGANLTWTLDNAGTLTISGTGAMWNRWNESYEKELLPAWRNYAIKKIVIGKGVTSIGEGAFQDCSSLTEVVIAGTVTEIGSDAFVNCAALKEVTISGAGVSVIASAFYGCNSLTTINYDGTMAQWKAGAGATVALPLCANVTCTDGTITPPLSGSCGTSAHYSISSAGVLTISGTGAMADYNYGRDISDCPWHSVRYAIKEIVIEDGITHIGKCAFMFDTDATSVSISNSVTSVGDWAFCGCYNLTEITLPEGLESIGDGAFDGCSALATITIPAGVTSIGENAFLDCNLTTINFGGTEAQWNAIGGNDTGVHAGATIKFTTLVASGKCGDNLTWTLDSAGLLTISGTGAMGDYYYDESKTPWSDCPWHEYRYDVKKIVIENGVTSIGESAFHFNCYATSVSIPGSVTSIGYSAFFGCYGLTSVTIPEGVTRIGDGAFYACSKLASISLPVSLQAIGYGALYAVNDWDEGSQYYGSKLTDIYYGGSSMRWAAIGGNDAGVPEGATIHYAKESDRISGECGDKLTWTLDSDGLLTISGTGAMWNRWDESYEKELLPAWRNYTINKLVIGNDVTYIGSRAFLGCTSLTEVIIPSAVTEVGYMAFVDCADLTTVAVSSSATSIKCSAFVACDSLTTINFGGTMAQWKAGNGRIVGLPLNTNVVCTDGTIAPVLSGSCGTSASYSISSSGVLTISGTGAMDDYTLDSNNGASDCPWNGVRYAITKIVINDGITHIGNNAFAGDSFATDVTIPDSVISIGGNAFWDCNSLTEITIPDGVTSIGAGAFHYCISLTTITIPASVVEIGSGVFEECTSLTTVNFGGTEAQWNAIGGGDTDAPEGVTINFATSVASGQCGDNLTWTLDSAGTLTIGGTGAMRNRWDESYETILLPAWYDYTIKKILIGNGVTSIGDGAFQDCSGLMEVVIAGTVTEIGSDAFANCTALKEVTISGANVSVIANAFYGCDSLTTINYGGTVEQWKTGVGAVAALPLCANVICTDGTITPPLNGSCGTSAHYNISSDGVLTISGTGAMADYTYDGYTDSSDCPWHSVRYAITAIVIGDDITHIGDHAFMFDISAASVTIPNSVTSVGNWAFCGCYNLTEITLPEGLESIGDGAFDGCSALTAITIPVGVTSIGEDAFLDCLNLATINYDDTEARWRNIGGGKAGVPESTTITYSELDTALEKAGFTAPGTIFTDGDAEYDVSFPNYYNKTDNPGGILPDVYFDGFKDVSIGELTLTLHDNTAEAWKGAYIQSAGWFGISDRVMCMIPYYAPAGATQYAAYIGTDANAALAFATSGGQRYSNDGGCCPMGTPIAEVDTSNGRMTNVDDYTTYYLIVWYNAAGAPIARHALRIHVTSEPFSYALSVDDLLRGTGYAVPTTSQFYIDVPAGLVEDIDYTISYDQTTGHATVKLLPGNETHWQQAFESLLEIVAGFEKPQSSATRLNVYFGDRDDSGVSCYIGGTYGDYYDWYTGDNLRPGSGRTFASVSEDADSNVTISVPQGSSWVRCIAVWADSSGNVLDKFMYTLGIEADNAFSHTWNVNEAEETPVASGECGDNLTWALDNAGTLTISGTGAMDNYYYDEDRTPWSDCPWHEYRSAVRKVIIEDGVTSIGNEAFTFNYNMESVSVPGSVTSIGYSAFYGCYGLTDVTIPEGVTHIGDVAFYACSKLVSISLPASLKEVGANALYAVNDWEEGSQYYGSELKDIYYGGSSIRWAAIGGDDASVPEGVTIHYAVESDSVSGKCGNNLTWTLDSAGLLTISGTGEMDNYTYDESKTPWSDCPWHEYRSAVRKVIIEDGVTSIGSDAFIFNCYMESVSIPNSVTSIGFRAFSCCYGLTDVTIPEGVTSIGEYAFYACSRLESISLPASLKEVGDNALYAVKDWEEESQYYGTKLKDIYYTSSEEQWASIKNIDKAGIPADVTVTYILRGVLSGGDEEKPSVLDMQNLYTYLTTDEIETGSLYAENEKAYQLAADVNGDGDVDVYDLQGLYETVALEQPSGGAEEAET